MTDYTYFAREHGTYGPVKIGRSGNIRLRISRLESKTGKKIDLICAVPFDCERGFHAMFADWHRGGEWFEWSRLMRVAIYKLQTGTFDFGRLPDDFYISGVGRHRKPYIGKFAQVNTSSEQAAA